MMSNINNTAQRLRTGNRLLCACTLVMALIAVGAEAQVITLERVLSLIDKQNPMLEEYESNAKAIDAYASGAKSWMAPMVGVGTFMTPYANQEMMHDSDKGSWMFSIEQEIPNPAKLKASQNYARSKADVEQQKRAIQYNVLRSQAKRYYYQWLVAEEKLRVLKESERIMELMLKLGHIRYPYSQGSLGNIYKAEGRLSEVRNMMLMTRSDIEESSFGLKSLANIPASDSIMIDTTTTVAFKHEQVIYDMATLSEQRSDLKKLDETIEVMRLNQRLQQFQAKPDFKLRFDHMRPIGDMPAQFSAMAMVSIPIAPWSSKMYKAEIRGTQYEISAMESGREAILLETRAMLDAIVARISSMETQLHNYKAKIIPALRKNYQTLMLAYEENREQLPIVIDGWEALNTAEMEYLTKREDYYMMIVDYEKEMEK